MANGFPTEEGGDMEEFRFVKVVEGVFLGYSKDVQVWFNGAQGVLNGYQRLFKGFEDAAVGSLCKVPKGVERVLWRIVTLFKGCCKEFAPLLITCSL